MTQAAPLGVVLVGGRSSRMGRDKAAVEVGGRASARRVADALAAVLDDVVTAGGDAPDAIVDVEPGGGPLQAVVAAFRAHPGRALLVAACDLPLLDPALVRVLAAPLPHDVDARVPRDARGRPQPLIAHYGARAAAAFEDVWAGGQRAMRDVLARLRVAWVDVADLDARAILGMRDFDTPAALAELRQRASETAPE